MIVLAVNACAGISDFYVSQSLETNGQYKDLANGVDKVQLDDIRVYANPYNHRFARGGAEILLIPLVDEKKMIKGDYSKGNYLYENEERYDEENGFAFIHNDEGNYFVMPPQYLTSKW